MDPDLRVVRDTLSFPVVSTGAEVFSGMGKGSSPGTAGSHCLWVFLPCLWDLECALCPWTQLVEGTSRFLDWEEDLVP